MRRHYNRRVFERVDADLYVNKIIGDEPHLVKLLDISEGGAYLGRILEPTERTPKRVGLEIQLPGDREVIWAVGRIVRQSDEGVAVRFERLADNDRKKISAFVRSRDEAELLSA